ncbi:aspartyl-tRNA(Asn)/glutamyl-tRNA (Gln) amidotransferase subunit A [Klebsormidium nitens]|uniref:Aspartyl-tRNA(Asn)/glutamyl-tRNA (Gln) amidotransferase subunit A n=1 Tax=Klebsormidium nitens TaxID=105231 RepID=A0A1Y1I8Y3_KLENI|nr:aspartyl-tRNA(Asn)/glutamyl-tRNA (Gln) amidotransferase subunit A [Klebsormidium nitens]|eukprot:GAQ84558.1 aspartyl-tRNA(Asn)/glutamyl-tRNA (Gln) amidotransferase subunit A [Klebsormidium nitens]
MQAVLLRAAETEDAWEPALGALLPEAGRRERLQNDAESLVNDCVASGHVPPLFGFLVAIKDTIHVSGMETRAGSLLPPSLLAGDEAPVVTDLKAAGALILGKAATSEFAHFEPAATRNPVAPGHTPGGSSSGPAAAVAAGLCDIAVGTQTIGSISRPAAYCGVVGFKPSKGRISIKGIIPCSPSIDQVGFFTRHVAPLRAVCSATVANWEPTVRLGWSPTDTVGSLEPVISEDPQADFHETIRSKETPLNAAGERARVKRLGVPDGPFLRGCEGAALADFEKTLGALARHGFEIVRVPALEDIADIDRAHRTLEAFEIADLHREWFRDYAARYRPKTVELIIQGQNVAPIEAERGRQSTLELRHRLESLMAQHRLDGWIAPAATGPPPFGLGSTGDPRMSVPWSHSGLPTVTLCTGHITGASSQVLPLAVTVAGHWGADEALLCLGEDLEAAVGEKHWPLDPPG